MIDKQAERPVLRGFFGLRAYFPRGRTLDLGCAAGNYSPFLSAEVVGLDLDLPALRRIESPRVQAIHADANADLPFRNESFNLVFCSHLLEHVESPLHLLREARRILRLDGTLVIGIPIEGSLVRAFGDHYYRNHTGHLYGFTLDGMRRILSSAHFIVDRIVLEPPLVTRFPRLAFLMSYFAVIPEGLGWRLSTATWIVARPGASDE